MKIISWNCNGALRKKFATLAPLNADVHIIQECEDPEQTKDAAYKSWAENYIWIGRNKNKGVGIFAKESISLKKLPLDSEQLEYFLPCLINDTYTVIGVWASYANSPTFGYIGQVWKYLQLHKDKLNTNTLLIGDFNSNTCWDKWDRWWNHSDVVKELDEIGMSSLYHNQHQQIQGAEIIPTFFMHRKLIKPYHIDYAFISKSIINYSTITIGEPSKWLNESDHMPLLIELK